jgi:hypothetical protein
LFVGLVIVFLDVGLGVGEVILVAGTDKTANNKKRRSSAPSCARCGTCRGRCSRPRATRPCTARAGSFWGGGWRAGHTSWFLVQAGNMTAAHRHDAPNPHAATNAPERHVGHARVVALDAAALDVPGWGVGEGMFSWRSCVFARQRSKSALRPPWRPAAAHAPWISGRHAVDTLNGSARSSLMLRAQVCGGGKAGVE